MTDNDDLIILVMITGMMYEYYRRRRRYKKRFWVRPLYKNRDIDGFFVTAFDHMYNKDFEQFKFSFFTLRHIFPVFQRRIDAGAFVVVDWPPFGDGDGDDSRWSSDAEVAAH
uniref:Uncharacterized protein n=1 Tax=Glossina pallidipes TaxID=7398 RepID=A0A1A9Z528_GLOPL